MAERPPPVEIGNSLRKPGHKPPVSSIEEIQAQNACKPFWVRFRRKRKLPKLGQETTLKGIMRAGNLKLNSTAK